MNLWNEDTESLISFMIDAFEKKNDEFYTLYSKVLNGTPLEELKDEIESMWIHVREYTCDICSMYDIIKSLKSALSNTDGYGKIYYTLEDYRLRTLRLQSYAINLKYGKLDCIL